VCGLTPLAEEFLFRGTLLGWAMKRRVRPAILLAVGAVLGGLQGGLFESPPRWGAAVFAAVLVVGMAGLNRWRVYPPRTGNAIYATAAVFALVHSSVWPTPIPLFVLGLGLGYVSARTRGIAACVVAHGLFNAVSFVYLIRGGAGL
jgi:membrane protease YdiL (CAAX protease family)